MANTYNTCAEHSRSTYKDSGIAWIGEIPSEWEVGKMKNNIRFINGYAFDSNSFKIDGVYPVIRIGDIVNETVTYDNTVGVNDNTGLEQFKIHENDILIAMSGATTGKVGKVKKEQTGYINQRVGIIRCNNHSFVYFHFLMDGFFDYVNLSSIGSAQPNISSNGILNFAYLIPPQDEQHSIASFLDSKCSEIDSLISLQEEMISELQAYKQSVITEAVTKGLPSTGSGQVHAKMKDSGVEWIGEIPEHWEICKLKFLCKEIKDGSHFSPEIVDDGYPYITAGDVHGKGIDFESTKKISKADYDDLVKSGCKAEKNDVLIVKDGATTGRTGLFIDDTECVLLSSVAMLRVNEKTDSSYLMYLLNSNILQHQILMAMAGSAMPRITLTKLNKFIALEIPLSEQQSIATYLDTKTSQIDSLISLKQEKIQELRDYKKSIIYEYVTGKKRV